MPEFLCCKGQLNLLVGFFYKLIIEVVDVKAILVHVFPQFFFVEILVFGAHTLFFVPVMGVAEARGIIHKVIFESGIPLKELAPQTIKLSVTGNGRADKKAVAKMVSLILKIETKKLLDDTTDALAIAIAAAGG